MSDVLQELCDANWVVQVTRQIDGRYAAIARRPFQPMTEVLPRYEVTSVEPPEFDQVTDGILAQRASGATCGEAIANLAAGLLLDACNYPQPPRNP